MQALVQQSWNRSKFIEGSSHYLGDKKDFDVSSKGQLVIFAVIYPLPTLATVEEQYGAGCIKPV